MSLTTQTNTKLIGLNAVMNNPNLSKVVSDALNSPPGSLKREKAAAMLKSLKKVGDRTSSSEGVNPFLQNSMNPPIDTQISNTTLSGAQPPRPQPKISPIEPLPPSAQNTENPTLDGTLAVPQPKKFIWQAEDSVTNPKPQSPVDLSEGNSNEYYDTWYNNLSQDDKTKWKPLYEAVKAGIGPKTYSLGVQSDVNEMQKFMPDTPKDMIPQGASLAGQVNKLEDALKEEYKVNQLRDNVTKLTERGLTIKDDLKGYMTSRDQYIERLDSLIDTTNQSMVDMDMANPYINKRMNNYRNYLYILKGRQQKRYADFLKTAINQHNLELVRAKDSYNTAIDQFNSALKGKTNVLKEDYNNFNDMLQEQYTNLAKKREKELRIGILNEQLLKANHDNVQNAIDAAGGGGTMTDSNKEKSLNNYLHSNKGMTSKDWKKLSEDDQRRWVLKKPSTALDETMILSYMKQVSAGNPKYISAKGNILPKSIPEKYMGVVVERIRKAQEEAAAAAANQQNNGGGGESMWSKIWNAL